MTIDPLDGFTEPQTEETKAFVEMAENVLAGMPKVGEMTVQEMREQQERQVAMTRIDVPEAFARTIPGPDGALPLSIIQPTGDPAGIYLHIHGGGWVSGEHTSLDARHRDLAADASVVTIDVGYRLAPEHPFPAAPDDCEAAALWCVEHATKEFGTDRIVIGGESAGAHLSAVTLLRLRDKHGYSDFAGAELRYGLYDMRLTPSVRNDIEGRLGLKSLTWLLEHVASAELYEDPGFSPLLASLHEMPPALFTIGTLDTLVDDTLFMWSRWRAAGNDAALRVYPGGMHAFDMAPDLGIAREAIEEITRFVRDRVKA